MNLPDCVWYVSDFVHPWEADVIGNLAETLKSRGASLRVYAKGGTARLNVGGIMSWNSLTFFERARAVLFGGKLWHLWGAPPVWWGLVRLRARTVHTSLSAKPRWRGHPTRLFKEQTGNGENRILPTFESKASWAEQSWLDDDRDEAVLIQTWDENADTAKVIAETWEALMTGASDGRFDRSKILVVDSTPSNALQAAFMTMRGVPVVARDSPLIREALGPGGFVAAPASGDEEEWKKTLLTAASDAGRSNSAAARRFLKENYSASDAAASLESLYGAVGRDKL
jgi:hypothetical protein